MAFRLDIMNAESRDYWGSIWLPVGEGFFRHISSAIRGEYHTFINIDKGIYIWIYHDDEDLYPFIKVTLFNIKKRVK
jgi:hypothetical protein